MTLRTTRRSLSICLAIAVSQAQSTLSQTQSERAAWATIAELGEGFVVWETNRDGLWRLWRRELDGGRERRLSPDEQDRDHLCPAVSPDGRWIAYLSQPRGVDYNDLPANQRSPLRLMRSDGTEDRLLVDDARRISGGNRAVVWMDANQLHFLDGQQRARRVDVRTGQVSEPLHADRGFLPNATMTYVMDRHHIHPLDAARGVVRPTGRSLDGCEPSFTLDGRWSVRMTGAGGPISRIDPATSQIHPLVQKDDPRLPRDRGYLYFPMVSPCRRLLAFGASPNQHDHFNSDYEVFVVPIHPDTLEVAGRPVRYTFHDKTDRYPDVFLTDLPLGRHDGEVPLTVSLTVPGARMAQWQSGDGATGGGATFTHRYSAPGTYDVVAVAEGRTFRGKVTARPAEPPRVLEAVVAGPRSLRVFFNEPVDASRARATLTSGLGARPEGVSGDGRTLTLTLAGNAPVEDELTLSGIRDRAQQPNALAATTVRIQRAAWPTASAAVLLLFPSGERSALARGASGALEPCETRLRGLARRDGHGALELARGAAALPGTGPMLSRRLRETGAFTLEVAFQSAAAEQNGPARIATLSRDPGQRNVTVGQERDRLILRLRTPSTGANGTNPQVDLGKIEPTREQHLLITYSGAEGGLAYLDGGEGRALDGVLGDLSNWEDMEFLLGDEANGDRDWRGRVAAVAVYDRPLTRLEARQSFEGWRLRQASRTPIPRWSVETRVLALSPMPTAAQVAPYREGLLLAEHVVVRAESAQGPQPGAKLRVAHWALLDGSPVPDAAELRVGTERRFELEPFDDQPQAKSLYLADTLEVDVDLPFLLDATPTRS